MTDPPSSATYDDAAHLDARIHTDAGVQSDFGAHPAPGTDGTDGIDGTPDVVLDLGAAERYDTLTVTARSPVAPAVHTVNVPVNVPVSAPFDADADVVEVWARAMAGLDDGALSPAHRAWVNLTRPLGLVEDTALLAAPNEFAKDVLDTRLRPLIADALSRAYGRPIQVAVTVAPAEARERREAPPATSGTVARDTAFDAASSGATSAGGTYVARHHEPALRDFDGPDRRGGRDADASA